MRSVLFALLLLAPFAGGSAAEAKLAELLVTDAGQLKTVELNEADVTAQIDPTTARVTYDLTFQSDYSASEGTFYFSLPNGAYAHEFGMWVKDRYQRSAIVEAQAGRVAYEAMVRRGVDPALLEWTAGNTFKMRVYPLFAKTPVKVRLVVGMPLALTQGKAVATLPLEFGKLDRFSLKIDGKMWTDEVPEVAGLKALKLEKDGTSDGRLVFTGRYKNDSYLPPAEIRLTAKEEDKETVKIRREDGDERYFETHVFPKLPADKRDDAEHAVIYWDFSLSEAGSHEARLDALKRFLKVRAPKTIDLYGFQQHVYPVKLGLKGKDLYGQVQAALKTKAYDGATRIDVLLGALRETLPKLKGTVDLALFTNGVDSFELFDWKKQKPLAAASLNAFIIAPTTGTNTATLNRLAKELGAVVLDQDDDLPASRFEVRPWRVAAVTASKTLQKVESPAGDQLFPGDAVVVRGQVKKDGPASFTLKLSQNGRDKKLPYKFDTSDVDPEKSETVPRLWAKERIDRLLPEKRTHQSEITQLALTHQLMSPFTVMVVLETCEDYAEFKLKAPKDCQKRQEDFRFDVGGIFDDEGAGEEDYDGAVEEAAGGEASASAPVASADSAFDMEAPATGQYAAAPEKETPLDFSTADISGQRRSAASDADAMAEEAEDVSFDDEFSEASGSFEDTKPRLFGFEHLLAAKSAAGADALYAAYLKNRGPYEKIPYYYIFAADLFAKLKRVDLADLVLSNLVEIRPGEARWLRVYAYNLIAWGKAQDTVAIYRAVTELRGEDPQSFRDFGLALEQVGQPAAAMRLFEKVKTGKWDERLEGMNRTVLHDLARAAKKVLALPNQTVENRIMAQKYANASDAQKDKITVTVSWDTDNTDIDLHVVEPTGTHVWYANKEPKTTAGRLNWDSVQGFGPEQYRNAAPVRGTYRVFLHYFASDPAALADGTFVRIDFKVVQNGVEQVYTKTAFLRDREQNLTIASLDYVDPNAKLPPPDFGAGLARAKALMDKGQDAEALKALEALGKRSVAREEAQRQFHLGRAQIHLKRYAEAELSNQRALALEPSMVAAHFNNACAASLAKDTKKAAHHLDLLADALQRYPNRRMAYLRMMRTDPDLTFVRASKGYKDVAKRLRTGH